MSAAEAILEGQLPTFQTTIHSKHAAYPSKSVFAMQGKHIIELGAGCGLVGLVFAAHGANVLLTDLPNVMVSLVIVLHSTKRVKDTDFSAHCQGAATPMALSFDISAFIPYHAH